MKWIVLPVTLAALAACSKPTSKVETPATPETQISETTPNPEATASPAQTKAEEKIAAATPAPQQFAPDGVYFLRVATLVETDAGVLGIKRGSQLTKVNGQTYRTGEGDLVKLEFSQVTNDLSEVKQILEQEQKSAATLANWHAEAAKAEQARRQAAAAAALAATPAPKPRSTTVATTSSLAAPQPRSSVMATPSSSLGVKHSAQKREGNIIYKKDVNGNWAFDRYIR